MSVCVNVRMYECVSREQRVRRSQKRKLVFRLYSGCGL